MDALSAEPVEIASDDPRLGALIEGHLAFCRRTSPACSVHALDAGRLAGAGARVFAVFDTGGAAGTGAAVAMGAVVGIAPGHFEIKSMHVAEAARGQGFGRRILDRLIASARADGALRMSLETGSQPGFAPARAMYAAAGFDVCGPFGDYRTDPASVFMTRAV